MGYCPLGTHGTDGPGEDFHATLAFIVSLGAVASLTAQLFPPFFLSFESPLYAKYIIEEQAEYLLHVSKVIIHKSRGEVFFAHENIKKLPSKVAYFKAQSQIFSTAKRPKISPNIIFCSIKMAHRWTYD